MIQIAINLNDLTAKRTQNIRRKRTSRAIAASRRNLKLPRNLATLDQISLIFLKNIGDAG